MKKDPTSNRILGRRLASEMKRDQLASVAGGVSCWTLTFPPDGPFKDH